MRKTIRSLTLLLISIVIACPPMYSSISQAYALVNNPQKQNNTQNDGSMLPLSEVLNSFENKYKVNFNYNSELIKDKKVKIDDTKNSSDQLDRLLNNILRPLKLNFEKLEENTYVIYALSEIGSLKSKNIMTSPGTSHDESKMEGRSMDQNTLTRYSVADITVSGKVTNDQGESLPGVTVIAKESPTIGTQTDVDGNYKLTVPNGTTAIIFSFIGFISEEMAINNQSTINVSLLPDIAALQEVVVVGYGTQQKKEVTGAISTVKGTDILKSSALSVSNSLAGRVPGLVINQTNSEPGRDDARVLIRGMGTVGDGSALIVVDGIANRDGISRIDPNDIESITVLKDASAAIYGAQAGNGVILITTKRGKTGKPSINYSFNQGFVSPIRKLKLADASLYAKSVNRWSVQQGQAPIYTAQQISDFESGVSPSTDWQEEVYKSNSIQNRHSLTLNGGTEVVKYFISAGTAYQNGLVQGDETTKYRQYNVRSNVDVQVSDRIKLGLNLAGRREDRRWLQYEDNTIYSNTIRAAPDLPATINGMPAIGRERLNPLAIAQGSGYLGDRVDVLNGTLNGEYRLPFIEGLAVDGFAAIDIFRGLNKHFYQQYSYYTDANGDGTLEEQKAGPSIADTYLQQSDENNQSITLNARIKYDRTFGLHSVSAFVAYEQNEFKADTFYVRRKGYVSDRIDEIYAGSADASNLSAYGLSWEGSRQSYFGRIAYNYNQRYFAQFHFRNDGSYKFKKGNRFSFSPGVSLGWRISEESFLKDNPIVHNLKLRGSWGKLANERVPAFQWLNKLVTPGSVGQGYVFGGADVNILNTSVAANPNVTWDTKTTLDIGLEAGFLKNRLTFEFDYFIEKRSDILIKPNVTVPDYTGLLLPDQNIGKVDNKGIDAVVNYTQSIGKLNFNIGGNITYAKNKVVFLDEGNVFPEDYQKAEGHPFGTPIGGAPLGSRLVYEYIGIYRTQTDLDTYPGYNGTSKLGDPIYRDVNEDGVINNSDRVRRDLTDIPQLQYGINLGAQFMGFDFSAIFQGQARAEQYFRYNFNNGNNGLEYFLKNAYDPIENPNGSLPAYNRGNTNDQMSTLWLRNTSFLRLKNIELGYSLPNSLTSKIGVQTVRVYVNGYNILTFDKLKKDGLPDPESIDIEGWQFPHTKSVNFGFNITL